MDPKNVNTCSVKHLIVDSAGFLRNAALKDIGEKIYTIEQVVSEIKDRATKNRLQVLPYELNFRTPTAESIKFVTEFSKKTGDYASLSPVDIKVIALTFQLHKEHGDASQIKYEPNKNVLIEAKRNNIAVPKGFYFEKGYKNDKKDDTTDNNVCEKENLSRDLDAKCVVGDRGAGNEDERDGKNDRCCSDSENEYSDEDEWFSSEDVLEDNEQDDGGGDFVGDDDENIEATDGDGDRSGKNVLEENSADNGDENDIHNSDDDGDDEGEDEEKNKSEVDDEGWITPKNIASLKKTHPEALSTQPLQVACLTTDFAMQNVLIQMGLSLVSLTGLLIRHARSYVLKCSACFKITKDVSKVFCYHCGNQTLQKIAMSVKEDGSVTYHVSNRRPANIRGLRYALPTPKGGKHAHNPLLCADQLPLNGRARGPRKKKMDPLDPDFIARDQPFSLHSLNAKGQIVAKNWDVKPGVGKRKNPNENRKHH